MWLKSASQWIENLKAWKQLKHTILVSITGSRLVEKEGMNVHHNHVL